MANLHVIGLIGDHWEWQQGERGRIGNAVAKGDIVKDHRPVLVAVIGGIHDHFKLVGRHPAKEARIAQIGPAGACRAIIRLPLDGIEGIGNRDGKGRCVLVADRGISRMNIDDRQRIDREGGLIRDTVAKRRGIGHDHPEAEAINQVIAEDVQSGIGRSCVGAVVCDVVPGHTRRTAIGLPLVGEAGAARRHGEGTVVIMANLLIAGLAGDDWQRVDREGHGVGDAVAARGGVDHPRAVLEAIEGIVGLDRERIGIDRAVEAAIAEHGPGHACRAVVCLPDEDIRRIVRIDTHLYFIAVAGDDIIGRSGARQSVDGQGGFCRNAVAAHTGVTHNHPVAEVVQTHFSVDEERIIGRSGIDSIVAERGPGHARRAIVCLPLVGIGRI